MPELDGLRGVAVLLVIAYHYFQRTLVAEPGSASAFVKAAGAFSWSGVDLFFVLSGFLIGGILFKTRDSPDYFKTFFVRRFFRIVPLYLLVCSLLLAASPLLRGEAFYRAHGESEGAPPWYVYATFTQNFWTASHATWSPEWLSMTWSLAVEEQFYLLAPFVIRYSKRPALVLAALVAAAPFFRVLAYYVYSPEVAPRVLLPCRADALALGMLAALLVASAGVRDWLRANSPVLSKALYVLFPGVIFFAARDPSAEGMLITTVGYTWIAAFYLCLLLTAITQPGHRVTRLLRLRALTWAGVVAYGAYLFHQAVNGLCHGFILGSPPVISDARGFGVTLLALALTLGLAGLSWCCFEKKFVAYGHTYLYRAGARPAGSQAETLHGRGRENCVDDAGASRTCPLPRYHEQAPGEEGSTAGSVAIVPK